jgi:hypothetical protein
VVSKYYELRFPRISKVFRRSERSWNEGTSLKEFQRIAREAVGGERPGKEIDDWCNELWGKSLSPNDEHSILRKQREDSLLAVLERVDKIRVNESEDTKEMTLMIQKKQVVSPQHYSPPKSPQPLGPVTNLSPSNEYGKEQTGSHSSPKGQKVMPEARLDKNGTPPPLKLPSPPTSRSKKKVLGTTTTVTTVDKSLRISSTMLTPRPFAQDAIHSAISDKTLSTDPKDLTFINPRMKRKRDINDTCELARKKTMPNWKRVTESRTMRLPTEPEINPISTQSLLCSRRKTPLPESTPTREQGSGRDFEVKYAGSASIVKPGRVIPLSIPPPPPPGASGWLPRRRDNGHHELNNSDKLALYYGTSSFYINLPRWEETQDSKENHTDTDGDIVMQNRVTTVEDPRRFVHMAKELPLGSVTTEVKRSSLFEQQALLFAETAVGKLMSTSIVWFARDLDKTAPAYRPSWGQLVPQIKNVTRLDALFVGCGWHMLMNKNFKKNGVDRGVIFIDFEEDGEVGARVKMTNIVNKCEGTWKKIAKWKEKDMLKPVWIVDARALRWDALEKMRAGDGLDSLEEFVLWKKV